METIPKYEQQTKLLNDFVDNNMPLVFLWILKNLQGLIWISRLIQNTQGIVMGTALKAHHLALDFLVSLLMPGIIDILQFDVVLNFDACMQNKWNKQTKPSLCVLQLRGQGNTGGQALDGNVIIFPLNEMLFCRTVQHRYEWVKAFS